MLVIPLIDSIPAPGLVVDAEKVLRMSMPDKPTKSDNPSLLWVNKDATNLHSKKHVAEVNAHVQKRGSRGQTTRRTIKKSSTSSSRECKNRRKKSESPGLSSNAGSPRQAAHAQAQQGRLSEGAPSPIDLADVPLDQVTNDGVRRSRSPASFDSSPLGLISQLAHTEDLFPHRILGFHSALTPVPSSLTYLPAHDQMLVQNYLAYVPESLYGLAASDVYCPIRRASINDVNQDPLGLLWVLIALDMCLAKARGDTEHTTLVLQRKDQAYRMMASRMNDPRDPQSSGSMLGTGSAALAELFFGDSAMALMHLHALEAMINAEGGDDAVARLPLSVTIPLFNAFAYRSLLQDNLLSSSAFDIARARLVDTLRSFFSHDRDVHFSLTNSPNSMLRLSETASFHDLMNNDPVVQLRQARHRAFSPGSILRSFIEPGFASEKATDSVDHFILLYNLNIALHDFHLRGDQTGAARFLDDLVQDIDVAYATSGPDSLLKISGIRCLFISRYAKVFSATASEGIARAWQSIDIFEVLKLLSSNLKHVMYEFLFERLAPQPIETISSDLIESIDIEISANWWASSSLRDFAGT